MVILIGNLKGGVGKSTVTLLLANYLSQIRQAKVRVIDMDYHQQSIRQKFQRAKLLENPEPYQVIPASVEAFSSMESELGKNPNELLLIDLPGKLDDDGLIRVFFAADLVLCPFSYDSLSFKSTLLFAIVLQKINPELQVCFIPNRIKAKVKHETLQQINEQLGKFGLVTISIPDRIDFQRVTTVQTPERIIPVITPVLDQIYVAHLSFLLDDSLGN